MSYEYANARLRAMKSRLLDRAAVAELLSCASVDDLSARLAQTAYGEDVQAALARYTGLRVVMEGCRLHLTRSLRQARGFFSGDGARLMDVLLARWDLFNLRTILRGHESGQSPEQLLASLVPAGRLDDGALRTLVRESEPLAIADSLKLWNVQYAQALREAWSAPGGRTAWNAFESALDRIFYERLLATLDVQQENDALVREYLAREIDATNILVALRLRADTPAPSSPKGAEQFLSGGDVPLASLLSLLSASRDAGALAVLRETAFGPAFRGLEALDLAAVQRALDHALARFGIAFFARDPLTIAPGIGFAAAKQAEVSNVRLIAQGIALQVKRELVEAELVFGDS